MALTITVLGCDGTYAGPGGACSGYLLRSATTAIWLECGPGSLANLQRHVPLAELDGIVVSHTHPDHWLELPVAANALRYGLGALDAGIALHWTEQTASRFGVLSHRPAEPTFLPTVISDGARETIGDIALTYVRTDHPVETLSVRADHGGSTIAYSADTGDGWDLADLGPGIDLAVIEATLDEHEADEVQHLTAGQAGRKAREAGVTSLLLTHLAPGSDPDRRRTDAAAAFDGPIDVAAIDQTHHV